ncbi:EamA family transporter [Micromonospora sp. CPCC 205371]|nr:EamA family transporter [Micromonospora sp. CPCC 205371]
MASGPLVVAAVLAAAVLHAGWNAIAKGIDDRIGLFARASVVDAVAVFAVVWWLPMPAAESWPWLLASVVVQVAYILGLMAAYRVGDFNQTYPLARGIGPLVVAVVAVTVIGEPLPLAPALGVLLIAVAVGVLGLTPWRRIRGNRAAVLAATGTGVMIATYTLLDGIGVRRSGTSIGYIAWLIGLHSLATIAATAILRRTRFVAPVSDRPQAGPVAGWGMAAATGLMSTAAYGLVLWAQSRGALAAVAALRESSVVVAAVLGVLVFREPMGRVRIAASLAVAAGVVLLAVPA